MSADEQAIRKLIDDWMAATAGGDLEQVLSMMSDDVVFMTPGREPFGKREFAAQSAAMKDTKVLGVAKPVEIKVLGDWAWLRNHITVTMTAKDGQATKRAGYTLTLLNRKPDGLGHHAGRKPAGVNSALVPRSRWNANESCDHAAHAVRARARHVSRQLSALRAEGDRAAHREVARSGLRRP
jgi:uncharacterized protein (TIGR02246 family)